MYSVLSRMRALTLTLQLKERRTHTRAPLVSTDYSRIIHGLFIPEHLASTDYSRIIHGLFTDYSRIIHGLFIPEHLASTGGPVE